MGIFSTMCASIEDRHGSSWLHVCGLVSGVLDWLDANPISRTEQRATIVLVRFVTFDFRRLYLLYWVKFKWVY